MKRNKRALWLTTTALSLSAFSFAAGFGIRSLTGIASSGPLARLQNAANLTRLASAAPGAGEPDLRPAELYKDVYNKLHLFYVEKLPGQSKLAHGSIEQMLAELKDPNTRLISPQEWKAIQDLTNGQLHGLGAVVTVRSYAEEKPAAAATPAPPPGVQPKPAPAASEGPQERNLTIVAPLPGSAAEKAGLLPGDRITHLDGKWIAPVHLSFRELSAIEDDLDSRVDGRPLRPDENAPAPDPEIEKEREKRRQQLKRWVGAIEMNTAIEELLTGKSGERELTIERKGADKPLKIKVAFAEGASTLFTHKKINPTTGYVRVAVLTAQTAGDMERALSEFQRDGIQKLVVDLRHSPGGSLEAAKSIVTLMAPGATVLMSRERDAARKMVDKKILARAGTPKFKPAAISVLIDGGTAGSSEVLAAALKESLGARLVGSTTFGDGSEQQIVPLPDGAAVSITHANMLTPKGVEFDGKGLQADFPGGPGDQGIDAGVKALEQRAGPLRIGTIPLAKGSLPTGKPASTVRPAAPRGQR